MNTPIMAGTPEKLVVIGNGMAAGRVLEELLECAPGRYAITIFGAEPRVNYNRIMLSPVLAGEKTYEDILIHDDAWYARHGITLHKGQEIVAIDREAKQVRTADGRTATYDKLLLATGSLPFIVPVPGADLPGVPAHAQPDHAVLPARGRHGPGRPHRPGAAVRRLTGPGRVTPRGRPSPPPGARPRTPRRPGAG